MKNDNLTDLLTNLGIDVGGIAAIGVFWRNDLKSQKSRLQRIQKGGRLAGLKLRIQGSEGPLVVKLSDLRRDRGISKRVVIVAAPVDLLQSSLASSIAESVNLIGNDLIVVPLQIDLGANAESFTLSNYRLETAFPPESNALGHIGVVNRPPFFYL